MLKKRLFLVFSFLFACSCLWAKMDLVMLQRKYQAIPDKSAFWSQVEPYFTALDQALADTLIYHQRKMERIQKLERQLQRTPKGAARFQLLMRLYEEYAIVNFKSMYHYAKAAEIEARNMGSDTNVALAYIAEAEAYRKGGYFRESHACLQRVDTTKLDRKLLIRYYMACYELDFENGFFLSPDILADDFYGKQMQATAQKLEALLPADSPELVKVKMQYLFHISKYAEASVYAQLLVSKLQPGTETYAYHLGNIGYTKMGAGEFGDAIKYMTLSAVEEIKLGSYEYPVMRKLAELMHVMGKSKDAYRFSRIGLNNAEHFDSKYRKYEVSQYYPQINALLYDTVTRQNTFLIIVLVLFCILLLVGAVQLWFIIRQNRRMKERNKIIEEQHLQMEANSKTISSQNESLRLSMEKIEQINQNLMEANAIKVQVIADIITRDMTKREKEKALWTTIGHKIVAKDLAGIKQIQMDKMRDMNQEFENLDGMILSLFPGFVEQYNALMRDDTVQELKPGEKLTPEMRIFALVRLGVSKMLTLPSVSTIRPIPLNVIRTWLSMPQNTIKTPSTTIF